MGLTIPTYDPLSEVIITDEQDVIDAVAEAATLPIWLGKMFDDTTLWYDVTPESLLQLQLLSEGVLFTQYARIPFLVRGAGVVYADSNYFLILRTILAGLYAARMAYIVSRGQYLVTQLVYDTVTARDLYWKEWLGLGSNLEADIPAAMVQTFNNFLSTYAHADIVIGGTDANEISVASGSTARTAIASLPICTETYFEVDIGSNTGDMYIGFVTRDFDTAETVGNVTGSFAIKVTGKTIVALIDEGATTDIVDIDCSVGAGFTLNRVCIAINPFTGVVGVSKDGVTLAESPISINPFFGAPDRPGLGFLGPGRLYPAVTVFTSSNSAKFHFNNTNSLVANYAASSAHTNEANNYCKGSYILSEDATTPAEYRAFLTASENNAGLVVLPNGMVDPFASTEAAVDGGGP